MYMSVTSGQCKDAIVNEINDPDGSIREVFWTSSLAIDVMYLMLRILFIMVLPNWYMIFCRRLAVQLEEFDSEDLVKDFGLEPDCPYRLGDFSGKEFDSEKTMQFVKAQLPANTSAHLYIYWDECTVCKKTKIQKCLFILISVPNESGGRMAMYSLSKAV